MIRRFIWRGSLRFPLSAQFYKHCLQLYTERDPLYLRSGWKLIANNKLHTLVRNLPCDVALLCFFFFFVYCSLPSMRCVALRFESCFLTAHPSHDPNVPLPISSHIAVRAHSTGEGEGLRIIHNARPIVGCWRRIATVRCLLCRGAHFGGGGSAMS